MYVVVYAIETEENDEILSVKCITDSMNKAYEMYNSLTLENYMLYKAICYVEKDIDISDLCNNIIVKEEHEVFSVVQTIREVDNTIYSSDDMKDTEEYFNKLKLRVDVSNQKKLVSNKRGVLKTSNFLMY